MLYRLERIFEISFLFNWECSITSKDYEYVNLFSFVALIIHINLGDFISLSF